MNEQLYLLIYKETNNSFGGEIINDLNLLLTLIISEYQLIGEYYETYILTFESNKLKNEKFDVEKILEFEFVLREKINRLADFEFCIESDEYFYLKKYLETLRKKLNESS